MYRVQDEHIIVARCTPQGSGATALMRISGVGAIELADQMAQLSSGKKLADGDTHTIHHGFVVSPSDTTSRIDEVLFLLMRGPRTYTGQDTVEITSHHNQYIIEQIIATAISLGARLAQPGEFTKRAFLSGKIDLVQAESLHDVITAHNETALRIAQSQLQGTLSAYLRDIEKELLSLLSFTEASFEFLDEEQRDLDFDRDIRQRTQALLERLHGLGQDFAQQSHIRDGIRITLLGSVNAGKSTLFNALLRKERAIVADSAGTTRDVIEGSVHRDGLFWTFIDTAGLRKTDNKIEQEGISRAWDEAARADVNILVYDGSRKLTAQEDEIYQDLLSRYASNMIVVENKIDDPNKEAQESIAKSAAEHEVPICAVSAKTKQGIDLLRTAISARIEELFKTKRSPFLLTNRQHALLSEVEKKIALIVQMNKDHIEYELIAHHLKEALSRLAEITGKEVHEKMLDTVFRDFCIGK